MLGALLIAWTIRGALLCYVLYLAGWLTATSGWLSPAAQSAWPKRARACWTLGCGLFLVHVACAFHFVHRWSHAAAFETTARETERLLGVSFGYGIYFSYFFLVLWVFDVAWLWTSGSPRIGMDPSATGMPPLSSASTQRPNWRLAVHIFLFFIAINGAIVFESGPTRWAGMVIVPGLTAWAVWQAASRRSQGWNAPALPADEAPQEARPIVNSFTS